MIVYTPIDIPCRVPEHSLLVNFVKNNYVTNLKDTFGYTSLLAGLVARYPVADWRDATKVFSVNSYEMYKEHTLNYAPGVAELFPELIEILHSLPYKQIIGAALSLHTTDLPPHNDDVDVNLPTSPERYNVLLTPHYGQDSFFLCKEIDGDRTYPTILKDYPIYAFSNRNAYHGADTVLDDRVIMICSGVIDEDKHQALINRSADKFKEHVIEYG
jgi:hypothetical protein